MLDDDNYNNENKEDNKLVSVEEDLVDENNNEVYGDDNINRESDIKSDDLECEEKEEINDFSNKKVDDIDGNVDNKEAKDKNTNSEEKNNDEQDYNLNNEELNNLRILKIKMRKI